LGSKDELETYVIEKGIQCLIVGMGRTKKTPTKYPFILQKENSL